MRRRSLGTAEKYFNFTYIENPVILPDTCQAQGQGLSFAPTAALRERLPAAVGNTPGQPSPPGAGGGKDGFYESGAGPVLDQRLFRIFYRLLERCCDIMTQHPLSSKQKLDFVD